MIRPASLPAALFIAFIVALAGCSDKLATAPVSGKVTYQDKPLTFGYVLFQPNVGPPGRGEIKPDGTYELSTYGQGDGAVIGWHRVQIICLDTDDPKAKQRSAETEMPSGRSIIPEDYSNYVTSGLKYEVKVGGGPYDIPLK